ncbi:hypothetical protein MGYG_06925 [Nannizzia gypsea CBS 118893]|uniref:Uncharacterized protein n=1 Tax=Arthroderma gypseum (strain ATCC MYA-4604 / CBS 118893) TaxID=535722 RepID=E4V1L1_ARTGP|nr:hypothetical protein MGYG_06925 [Nannizzia gypsea CBS 118893]EFR03926.1 hypothetical protein MGYG_06925 [Nannizzia gypsea CBS 118893]
MATTALSFASPVTHTAGGPFWPRPSRDGRCRFSRGSSDDSDEVRPDGWTVQDFRVGGPKLAQSPGDTIPLSPGSQYRSVLDARSHLSDAVLKTLQYYHIHTRAFVLCHRRCAYFPDEDPVPTLLVVAKRHSAKDQWLIASKALHGLLNAHGLSIFNVEICDKRANPETYSSPVPSSDPIYPLWDKILAQILDKIDLSHILTIECLRFGESSDRDTNPITVFLTTAQVSTSYSWKNTREAIVSILSSYSLDHVGIFIAHGRVYRSTDSFDQFLPESAWQAPLQLGLSLGLYQSTYSSSTFGGWIEIQEHEDSEWIRLGVTCFHSVIPNLGTLSSKDRSEIYDAFSVGIPANDPIGRRLRVEQPSLKDATAVINEASRMLDRTPDQSFQEIKEIIDKGEDVSPRSRQRYDRVTAKYAAVKASLLTTKEFHEPQLPCSEPCNNLFSSSLPINPRCGTISNLREDSFSQSYAGHVYAASGYRQILSSNISEKRMRQANWALLDAPKARQSNNSVRTYGDISISSDLFPLESFKGLPNENTSLFKLGRSTRRTMGKLSGLVSAHIPTHNRDGGDSVLPTYEYAVFADVGTRFSDPGDSGALVFDGDINCVGLLFAGNSTSKASYITILPDLFEDIKAVTGAFDVRIARDIPGLENY